MIKVGDKIRYNGEIILNDDKVIWKDLYQWISLDREYIALRIFKRGDNVFCYIESDPGAEIFYPIEIFYIDLKEDMIRRYGLK